MSNKSDYNKLHKDQTRIVTYTKPETKSILVQEALDKGISVSSLCEPVLEELANGIKQRGV